MDRVRLNEETGIPLFLLPDAIARQIKKRGDRIYRISVKRMHCHHYHVSIRVKSLLRGLAPGCGMPVLVPVCPASKGKMIAGGEAP